MRDSDKDNSTESYEEHKQSGRSGKYREQIYLTLLRKGVPMTDRELMRELGVTDPNLVRPEITRLKDDGVLISAGKVVCPVTKRRVRTSCLSGRPLGERGHNPHTKPLDETEMLLAQYAAAFQVLSNNMNYAKPGMFVDVYVRLPSLPLRVSDVAIKLVKEQTD